METLDKLLQDLENPIEVLIQCTICKKMIPRENSQNIVIGTCEAPSEWSKAVHARACKEHR